MEPETARAIATEQHEGQRNRFGDPVIDHVARVAAAVPPDARATALLHDLLECCPTAGRALRDQGLTLVELQALDLLTHVPGDPYEVYVRRIAKAQGPAGRLARLVKLADLDDHLAHAAIPPDAPPYAWARNQLLPGATGPHAHSAMGAVHLAPVSSRKASTAASIVGKK